MWRFKFSAWVVVLLMAAFSFGACDNDDDDTFVPPSNITEALKQVYPAAQNIELSLIHISTYLIKMLDKFGVVPSEIGKKKAAVEDFDAPTERMTSIIPVSYTHLTQI